MSIQFVPYTENEIPAVHDFNERMRAGKSASDFLLPERPHGNGPGVGSILSRHFLAADDGAVRGGFYEVRYPCWLGGRTIEGINYQSPLSEGLIDKKYLMLPMQMLKHFQKQGPYLFIVGMGAASNPLPRLLKAAGWSVEPNPFYFRVHRAGRFLRELRMLQSPWWKALGARVAALSGAGAVGLAILQNRGRLGGNPAAGYRIEPVSEWGSWADELWERFREGVSFGVNRDRQTLGDLYPGADRRLRCYAIRKGERVAGWSACLLSRFVGHHHFGSLSVGTVLDCVAEPEAMLATVALTDRSLGEEGADMVVTNQSWRGWQDTFRQAGFLSGPSNYLFAASPELRKEAGLLSDGRLHVTRGDGDGRINL